MQAIVQYHTLENSEIRHSYTLLLRVKIVFSILQTVAGFSHYPQRNFSSGLPNAQE